MDYTYKNGDIILSENDLDLDETLDCGQAFRWERIDSDHYRTYRGAFRNIPLTISQPEQGKHIFILHGVTEDEFLNTWADYFDLYTDYGELKKQFSEDEMLSRACSFAGGIRLLKQDAEEMLISFILSQNNNIPRIKGIIGRLCDMYGGFPEISRMAGVTADDLSPLRSGFRAKYIEDCVNKVTSGELILDNVRSLPLDEAAKALMTVKGIGPKVAMCVLLFGMYRTDAYPVDVWIKRVNERFYPNGLPKCTDGVQGIAQQYLFHYIRNNPEAEI